MGEARRICLRETGGPEKLLVEPFDPPAPGPGEIRVCQVAIGVNFIDIYHRTGLYPVKLPFIPGSEGAGVVEAVGEGVSTPRVGQRVAYLASGTYSSHVVLPAARALTLPDDIDEAAAAAILLKGLTAWMLLFEVRQARPGDVALVWAAAGGVGSLLVPWASALGVEGIAVTSTPEKAAFARARGAAHVVMADEDVAARAREITGGRGVDVSFDSVGRTSAEASLAALRPRGWWVNYGNASGPADPVAPGRLGSLGSLILTRPGLFHFIADAEGLRRGSAALFGACRSGLLKPAIGQRFALDDVAEAHNALQARRTTGSSLLIPS